MSIESRYMVAFSEKTLVTFTHNNMFSITFETIWKLWHVSNHIWNLQKIDEEKKRQEEGGEEEAGTSSAANIKKCSVWQQIGHNKKNMHC